MIITERIRQLVKINGWSLREFFRRLELDNTTMKAWEKGTASPEKHLPQIALILGTTVDYLRGETDDPSPNGTLIDLAKLRPSKKEFIELIDSMSDDMVERLLVIAQEILEIRGK